MANHHPQQPAKPESTPEKPAGRTVVRARLVHPIQAAGAMCLNGTTLPADVAKEGEVSMSLEPGLLVCRCTDSKTGGPLTIAIPLANVIHLRLAE